MIKKIPVIAFIAVLFCTSALSQQKYKPKFSASIQGGIFADITGNFKNGYNTGVGAGLRTSEHFEVFTEVNLNFTKEHHSNKKFTLNDYSLGGRVYIGKPKSPIMPIIEFALGVYPDFRDFGDYKRLKGGINFGAGTCVTVSPVIDLTAKAKLHLPVVTGGHPGGGFYVYSGFYAGIKYKF